MFVCTVYVRIVKIPEFLAVSIDVMAGRTPGHRTIEQITPFLPWLVASARTSVWMLAPCVSNLLWGSIWFLVGVTDLSCTCSPVFPQLQSSSEREIR